MEQAYDRQRSIFLVFGIALLDFLIYANTLQGIFLWDDHSLVAYNPLIRSWGNLGRIFSQDQGAGFEVAYGYYRPLTLVSYMADYSLWGLRAFGFHLTNILLHLLVALQIYLISRKLAGDTLVAFWGSLLFLVHPVQTEAVAYIADRADLLSAFFMFGCLLMYLRAQRHGQSARFYIIAGVSYLCALLSKENAVILPVLILAYQWSFRKKPSVLFLGAISFLALSFLSVRFMVLGSRVSDASLPFLFYLQRVPGFFQALGVYMRIMVWPVNLHAEYGNVVFHPLAPAVLLGVLLTVTLVICACRARSQKPVISFGIAWFVLAFIPVSGIYPWASSYMAERWAYFPSFGFFLIAGSLFMHRYRFVPVRVLAAGIVVVLSVMTFRQNAYWVDPRALFLRNLVFVPES